MEWWAAINSGLPRTQLKGQGMGLPPLLAVGNRFPIIRDDERLIITAYVDAILNLSPLPKPVLALPAKSGFYKLGARRSRGNTVTSTGSRLASHGLTQGGHDTAQTPYN